MPSIFISYRREDEPSAAGRLYDSLVDVYGQDNVFIDVDGIAPGTDFVDVIEDVLERCQVLVAVIGRHWLDVQDQDGCPRLEDPKDFVRLEISRALRRAHDQQDITVLPLCIESAQMPQAEEIPPELAPFVRLQAFRVAHVTWRRDVARLTEWLDAHAAEAPFPARTMRRWARAGNRPHVLMLGGLVAAAAVAVTALVLFGGGGASNDSIGALVAQPVSLQARPTAIAAGEGGIWTTEAPGIVEQIDPATGRIEGSPIHVVGTPNGVAAGAGAVWVAAKQVHKNGSVTGTVTVIDPTTHALIGKPIEVGAEPYDIAIGEGGVWTANVGDGSVSRIDPATYKAETYYFNSNSRPSDVAVGAGAVWVVQYASQTLLKINPATGKVLDRIPVARNPESVIVGSDAVWVASLSRDVVTKVDPKQNTQVGPPTKVGAHPDDMVEWQGGIYVVAKDAGMLQRIDPSTGQLADNTLATGNEPDAIAIYRDRAWVANAGDNSVVQVSP